jgi:hypothetical protein
MQHIILTALAPLIDTSDTIMWLVEIQGRRCQFFSTLGLDPRKTASIIGALEMAAAAYPLPFSFTLKFKVTASNQQTVLRDMLGIRFSVNYMGFVPYFCCCNYLVPFDEMFLFDFGEYANLYISG